MPARIIIDGSRIHVARFDTLEPEGPGDWLTYDLGDSDIARAAYEQLAPLNDPKFSIRMYLSFCCAAGFAPDWDTFLTYSMQIVPDGRGDTDNVLDALCEGDWVEVLFPACPDNVRAYLDPEMVYQDFFKYEGLEIPDPADSTHPGYVIARHIDAE